MNIHHEPPDVMNVGLLPASSGAVAAQPYQEPYAGQQMAAPYGNYVAPQQGPAMAPQQPVYQQVCEVC